nr:immunoglobulin light chain junction region [Macaca mulatta]MOX53028.1 immunoglobulin light chain junction region [Macaca mulatta]MOX53719.1 immunoglobulin light chain junction region [Macaca mulatta]MOX57913.1 immunoglobulin light chain junction region [Macaca mulatta]
CHQHNSYPHSF